MGTGLAAAPARPPGASRRRSWRLLREGHGSHGRMRLERTWPVPQNLPCRCSIRCHAPLTSGAEAERAELRADGVAHRASHVAAGGSDARGGKVPAVIMSRRGWCQVDTRARGTKQSTQHWQPRLHPTAAQLPAATSFSCQRRKRSVHRRRGLRFPGSHHCATPPCCRLRRHMPRLQPRQLPPPAPHHCATVPLTTKTLIWLARAMVQSMVRAARGR